VNITFYPYPNLQVYPTDTTICTTAPIQLNATGATNYNWSPTTFLNNNNIANPISTPTSNITYYLTANINPACPRTDSVTINIVNLDPPVLIPDTSLCGIDTFILNANSLNATSHLWSTNETTPTISISQTGQYWVRVQRAHCIATDTVNITMHEMPDLQIMPNDTTLCN